MESSDGWTTSELKDADLDTATILFAHFPTPPGMRIATAALSAEVPTTTAGTSPGPASLSCQSPSRFFHQLSRCATSPCCAPKTFIDRPLARQNFNTRAASVLSHRRAPSSFSFPAVS